MFLIRKNYPDAKRHAWWDGHQWVDHNYYALEFPRSKSALQYAMALPILADFSIVKVHKKDPLPQLLPLPERNGESNQRQQGEPIRA